MAIESGPAGTTTGTAETGRLRWVYEVDSHAHRSGNRRIRSVLALTEGEEVVLRAIEEPDVQWRARVVDWANGVLHTRDIED